MCLLTWASGENLSSGARTRCDDAALVSCKPRHRAVGLAQRRVPCRRCGLPACSPCTRPVAFPQRPRFEETHRTRWRLHSAAPQRRCSYRAPAHHCEHTQPSVSCLLSTALQSIWWCSSVDLIDSKAVAMVSGCGADWVWRKQQQEVAAGSSDFEGSFSAGKVRIVGAVVERDGKFLMVERLKRSRGFFEFPGLPFCPAPLSSLSRRRIGT